MGTKLRSSAWTNFVLIVVSLLVTILIAEGASRLFYYIRWGGHLYGIQAKQYSLRLGWEMVPGSYKESQINKQGFRRPTDVELRPGEKTIRIFIVGGSTAFGTNGLYPQFSPQPLLYEDMIDYHLQTILETRYPGWQFEVINAGVPEYRLFQEITLFREKLVNFQPDAVVFLDGHNDISFLTGGSTLHQQPAPYWANRNFKRGERALNASDWLGPFYFFDIYFGRVSYFYHGLSSIFQRIPNLRRRKQNGVPTVGGSLGRDAFRLSEENALMEKYRLRLKGLDEALSHYLDQVKDLKAIASVRKAKVLYALQPEIMVENPSHLTSKELQIQQFAFQHHRDFGTLSWRFLAPGMAESLHKLSDDQFRVLDLVTIAEEEPDDEVYTDYCHLTSRGNQVVADRLYPVVVDLIGEDRLLLTELGGN